MVALRWALAAALTAIFFLFGGVIIECIFFGIGKVAELSGAPTNEPPSYFITVIRRVSGLFFGSALAVYVVINLVKDLNAFLYLKIFNIFIITIQAVVVCSAIIPWSNVALILVFLSVLECLSALVGAACGFNLTPLKKTGREVSSDL